MSAHRDIRIVILSHLDTLPEGESVQPPALAKKLGLTGEQVNPFLSAAVVQGEVETLPDGSVRLHQRLRGQFSHHAPVNEPTKVSFAGKGEININISQSTIGILNTGEIEDVESIKFFVSSLCNSGNFEIADALKHLTEAVTDSQELSPRNRSEVLDQLTELGRQATSPQEQRSKPGVLNAIVKDVATILAGAGGLAKVWSTWGPSIKAFFGL